MPGETAFSELLRDQRRNAGLSQEELAERAGLSVGAVASLEQGLRRAPHRSTVSAIADALGMPEEVRLQFEDTAARARGRPARGNSGIPVSLTSFVERNELEEIAGLLADHRLLTITGSGGIGKTRIAIEVARRVQHLYDEAWLVDLLPVRDGAQVIPQIAARLSVPVDGDDGLSAIVQHLRSRHALLVIDNCEHLVDDAASAFEKLLRRCTALTLLTTSRESLAISGELAYRLPSMDVKAASELFVARAREADPKWHADDARLSLVVEICKELDGIPLAIELAASRVSTLGLEALRARLKGGISLTGSRDAADRHQTMAATIAWSYDMLSDGERLLFRRLSVFMGGFTLAAAEDVCSGETLSSAAVADALSQLVTKSLVNVEHLGTSSRYRFLEPIRAFAWERLLGSGELETSMLRFIKWLKQKAIVLESDPPSELLGDERIELDNVRFAVRWAQSIVDHPGLVPATEVLVGFRRVWFGAGRQGEFRSLAFGLLDRLKESEHPELVGLLIHSTAAFLTTSEVLALSSRGIPLLIAHGHNDLAAELHGRCAAAECERGDGAAAEEHLVSGEALIKSGERRTWFSKASFFTHGAYVRCMLHNPEGAIALLDGLAVPRGDAYELDVAILRAMIEYRQGRGRQAIGILTNAKPLLDRHDQSKHYTILVCGNLVDYYVSVGDRGAAERELREAAAAAVGARNFWLTTAIANLGRWAAFFSANSGRVDVAAVLLGAADRLSNPASLEDDATSRGYAAKAIDAHLSPERFEALRRRGEGEDLYELLGDFLYQPN